MWKKLLIISLCVSVLFVFSALITPVKAKNKSIPLNWQVAGSVANYVSIIAAPPDLSSIIPHYLISLSAQGPPGPAEITILGFGFPVDPTGSGCVTLINVINNEMVARFPDLSLLYATLDRANGGSLCIAADGTTFNVNMVITGGTGRFEGAEGTFTATGSGYNINPDPNEFSPLGAETGEFIGSIELHD